MMLPGHLYIKIVCGQQVDRRTGKFVRAAAARAKVKLDRVSAGALLVQNISCLVSARP